MTRSLHFCLFFGIFGICASSLAQTSSPSGGVDLKAIDKSVDPCQDFYKYRLRQLDESQSDSAAIFAMGPLQ